MKIILTAILVLWTCHLRAQITTTDIKYIDSTLITCEIYTNLRKALKNPDSVRLLDLSGKKLRTLPNSVCQFQNLVILDVGDQQKKLWLRQRVVKFSQNIGGGLRHLDRRWGKYFKLNYLESLPICVFDLKHLKFIDVSGNALRKESRERISTINKTNNSLN